MNLCVFPLKKELNHFLDHARSLGHPSNKTSMEGLSFYSFPSLNLHCTLGGHGKVNHAIATTRAINALSPKNVELVICAGAAGGLHPELQPGAVVVGTKTIEHDYYEKFDENAVPPSFLGREKSIEILKLANLKEAAFGIIASGDEDIVSEQRAQEIFEKFNALAVAWEGAGGARAARHFEIPFLEVRGITDNARDNVPESFKANIEIAMKNVTAVLVKLLESPSSN